MKILKKIILCSILLCNTIYLQDTLEPISETATNIVATVPEKIIETSTEVSPQENIVEETKEEKNELTDWKDHLKKLSEKGAFWDAANNEPDNSWLEQTTQLARAVLQKDISQAQELKNSFFSSIEDKYKNIEKSDNLKSFYDTIENFNKRIDDIVKELTPKEEKLVVDEKPSEVKKDSPEENVESVEISTPEQNVQATEEKTEDLSDAQQEEKRNQKLQTTWQECIENIKNSGIEEKELEAILTETLDTAKNILSTIFDHETAVEQAALLKKDYKQAIDERATELFPIKDQETVINSFNAKLDMIVQEKVTPFEEPFFQNTFFEGTMPMQFTPQSAQRQQSMMPRQNFIQQSVIEMPTPEKTAEKKEPAPSVIVVTQESTTPFKTTPKSKTKNLALEVEQTQLAQKIKYAAAQKALIEKQESQKGIASSFMGAVFGEWWTGPSAMEKTLKDIRVQQDKLLNETIANIERTENMKFSEENKRTIETAYYTFQDKLLSFDINALWDSSYSKPKDKELMDKWIKDIRSSLKILIQYNIMNTDTVEKILKETNAKIPLECHEFIVNKLKPYLEKYNNERIEEARRREQEKEQRMEWERQQALLEQKEKEKVVRDQDWEQLKAQRAQEKEKIEAPEELKNLEKEWDNLMQQIKTSKPARDETNKLFTDNALEIASKILKKTVLVPGKDKKQVTAQHISDFSNAFTAQQKNQDEHINVHQHIDRFNKVVHTL